MALFQGPEALNQFSAERNEKSRPAFWEFYPARGKVTLLFGKIADGPCMYMV